MGNVANNAREQPQMIHRADGQLDREHRAVFSLGGGLSADANNLRNPSLLVVLQVVIVLFPEWGRHEHPHVLANQLGGGVTEHLLGGLVHRLDDSLLVDSDDSVSSSIKNGLQTSFAVAKAYFSVLPGT